MTCNTCIYYNKDVPPNDISLIRYRLCEKSQSDGYAEYMLPEAEACKYYRDVCEECKYFGKKWNEEPCYRCGDRFKKELDEDSWESVSK